MVYDWWHILKRMEKTFHLGGGTQLLFDINGNRWDDSNYLDGYNFPEVFKDSYFSLYNENWIKPLMVHTSKTAIKVDGASYW